MNYTAILSHLLQSLQAKLGHYQPSLGEDFPEGSLCNVPFCWENPDNLQEACLLLHGLGGGVYEMQWLAQQLHQAGFSVQGINYPGHDKQARRMPTSAWVDWYDHISQTYDALSKRYKRVSLVGFSTGCLLALQLALEHSERHQVDKLVLLSPFLQIKQGWYSVFSPERLVMPVSRILCDIPRRSMPIYDKQMSRYAKQVSFFKTFNLAAVTSALDLIAQVKPRLSEIKNPTLIIQSRLDSIVDPSGAEYLMQYLGSEQKEVVWLLRSNHVVTLDYERSLVFDRVHAFLSKNQSEQGLLAASLCKSLDPGGL